MSSVVIRCRYFPTYLIEQKQEKISFIATDLEIQITTSVEDADQVNEERAVTVPAKKLQDILRALPDKVQVTLETGENRLHAKAGKSRFNLQTLPVEDFPNFLKVPNLRQK